MQEDWRALNRAAWEERTAIHLGPGGYDLSTHRAGRGRLDAIVEAELGSVAGLRVLHLQSHLGDDSLAIAQRGAAEVVGVDFSPAAVAAARALAVETRAANLRFVLSDVHGSPAALPELAGAFDLVFTSWGTIWWLPELGGWARAIAHFLKPGGAFYFADGHPAAMVFDDGAAAPGDPRPGWCVPYFERAARVWDDPTDYADPTARVANSRTVNWLHPLGDILGALGAAGLALDWLHEHPRMAWPLFRCLVRDAEGLWTWPDQPWLPLGLSLRCTRRA